MKRGTYLIILILITNLAIAQNIYQDDSLKLKLKVEGSFDLIPESDSASIKEVSTELFMFPQEYPRQHVLDIDTEGDIKEDHIYFEWDDEALGLKEFDYTAIIKTSNERREVRSKIPFPLTNIKGYEEYTLPTDKIDSNNALIIAKASELAEGEDDLFKVTFNLAHWVSENINYDLNELTTDVAQKASWVLQNKEGVCDEMTSLFVAMCRSLGIPARFVSGISYTEHTDVVNTVGDNWAGHGWAEVYFPNVGWVGFDITFDEYGYVDVTHIKLREALDPDEASTKFQWLADEVQLEADNLDLKVNILERGVTVPEEIQLATEILSEDVEFGSHNLVKGILKNTADYYVATILKLAVPEEVEIIGRDKRTILLAPKEVKETSWILKVSDDLDQEYWYQFPTIIYSEKNISFQDQFNVKDGESYYSLEEVEELSVVDEEKSYSRKVSFDCDFSPEINLDEEKEFSCTIKNSGNTNLKNIKFCLGEECKTVNLPINQEESLSLNVLGEEVGWNKINVLAENDLIEKKKVLSYRVLDVSKVSFSVEKPEVVQFGDLIDFKINLKKESFSNPQDVIVKLRGFRIEQTWEIKELQKDEVLSVKLGGERLASSNKFEIRVDWNPQQFIEEEIIIIGEGKNFKEKFQMFINSILNFINK